MAWTDVEIANFQSYVDTANPKFERFKKSSLHELLALVKTKPAPPADRVRTAIAAIPDKKNLKYTTALTYLRKHYPDLDAVTVGGTRFRGFVGVANEQARVERATLGMARCYEMVTKCNLTLAKVVPNTQTSKAVAAFTPAERSATELFQKWFDVDRRYTSVNRVRQVFTAMADALRSQAWEVVCYGTPEDPDPDNLGPNIANAFAFVRPGENAYRMYLGQHFWSDEAARIDIPTVTHATAAPTADAWQEEKRTKTSMDASIVTMIHELCHVRAISGATAIIDVAPSPYDLTTCKANAADPTRVNLALTNAENYAQFASAILMKQHFF